MFEFQKTILNDLKFEGVGLHTGTISNITIKPAKENTGIVFHRIDFQKPIKIKAEIAKLRK